MKNVFVKCRNTVHRVSTKYQRSMKHIFILFAVILFISSCTDAGLNGDATILVYPQHHNNAIINHIGYPDTVFLKFEADELPGTKLSDFDHYFIGTPREDFVRCEKLKAGQYYVYAVGIDSSGPARVTGGVSYKIGWSDRKDNLTLIVYVTE